MNKIDSMSAAVREVIDTYPAEHEFYGNQLKDDVVEIYPKAVDMYPDTILRMARRHRRYAFCVVNQNDSLYKKVEVIPISVQIKEAVPMLEPTVIQHSSDSFTQGFLFGLLVFALMFSGEFSHNSGKITEPVSAWIVENGKILRFSQNIFGKSLSLPHFGHDTFNMSGRANIRQPGKPGTKWHSLEAKGVFYDDYGRKTQRTS
jgi:hypothetical protein